ncbi:MAG: hypothetical protein WA485_16575 [Candidatus Sulfotelmatobacter sp.]
MDLEPKHADSGKPYEPPRLATISLRPEEAVLGACKTLNTGGHQGTCFSPICGTNVGS